MHAQYQGCSLAEVTARCTETSKQSQGVDFVIYWLAMHCWHLRESAAPDLQYPVLHEASPGGPTGLSAGHSPLDKAEKIRPGEIVTTMLVCSYLDTPDVANAHLTSHLRCTLASSRRPRNQNLHTSAG